MMKQKRIVKKKAAKKPVKRKAAKAKTVKDKTIISEKLTPQQVSFCNNILNGDGNADSYMSAYKGVKSLKTASAAATRLLKNVKIKGYIKRLRDKSDNINTLTRNKIREIRHKIALDKHEKATDRLKACSDEEKAQGWLEPERVNINLAGEVEIRPIEFTKRSILEQRAKRNNNPVD